MKKPYYRSLFIVIFLSMSCNSEMELNSYGTHNEEDLLEIGFNFGGEIFVSEDPLKAMEAEITDLFALQFYDLENDKAYARVVGNDISKIKVEFKAEHQYKVKMTYLKNGANIIRKTGENTWGTPFKATFSETEINKVYYTSSTELNHISDSFLDTPEDNSSFRYGKYVEVDRYHGVLDAFKVTEDTEIININMKRMVFGVRLNVQYEEADIDVIQFSINHPYHQQKYSISMTDGKGGLEIPFLSLGFPGYYLDELDYGVVDSYREDVHISIGTPENGIQFFDGTISVPRNVMMVMKFKPSYTDNLQNTLELFLEQGEMEEEEVNLPADN